MHAVGYAGTQHFWLAKAPAICSAKATPRPFKELMETTDWDSYGTGKYEKCAKLHGALRLRADRGDRRAEQSLQGAVGGTARRAERRVRWRPRSISIKQRPRAVHLFSAEVQKRLSEIRRDEALAAQQKASTAA